MFMGSIIQATTEDEEWDLYKKINEFPNKNVYQLAQIMGWSSGKTREAVCKLEKEGLVKVEKAIQDGWAVNLVRATTWQELSTPEEFDKLEI